MHGDRAERLRVLLSVAPWASDPNVATEQLPYEDLLVLDDLEPDDLALANACYEVERELRDRGFDKLERLGALVTCDAAKEADLDERIEDLQEPQLFSALVCLFHLGWID